MGHIHNDREPASRQGSCRAPRQRRCLLKGCEQFFKPDYPQARYCGPACRRAATRWRCWRADQTWRKTERGRACRRQQSIDYRQNVRDRQDAEQARIEQAAVEQAAPAAFEGERPADVAEAFSCARPGCYERFIPVRHSPRRRFCSGLCRKALRRVLQREARWGWRRKGGPPSRRRIPPWRKKVRRPIF